MAFGSLHWQELVFWNYQTTKFSKSCEKYWRTGKEGCILIRLSYCPESFLRRD